VWHRIKTYGIVLWIGIVIIFGVIASKIVEHNLLENIFVEVLTILLLIALVALSWLAGWSYKTLVDKEDEK
jgi:membrane protein DedA with SNARE-associated domain